MINEKLTIIIKHYLILRWQDQRYHRLDRVTRVLGELATIDRHDLGQTLRCHNITATSGHVQYRLYIIMLRFGLINKTVFFSIFFYIIILDFSQKMS